MTSAQTKPSTNLPPPPKKPVASMPSEPDSVDFPIGKVEAGSKKWRVVLNCTEGWGKTTCMAYAENPLIVMCGREIGFKTLREHDRVPDVDCVSITTWLDFMKLMRSAAVKPYATICIDSMGALYSMLHSHVLSTKFSSDEQKFQAYGRGISACETEWNTMLNAYETLDANMILASHVEATSFNNPDGQNYHRYTGNVPKQLWALTSQWADAVLFGTFLTVVENGKATGGTSRVVYTEHRASHDAKNRFGMESFISVPDEPEQVFGTLFTPIIKKG